MMIEHTPWIGPNYPAGIHGQRICIVGYSHHHSIGEVDSADFTTYVVDRLIKGTLGRNSFFAPINGYFGISDRASFWNRVMFFNFLPNVIGETEQKFGRGDIGQIDLAKKRFQRIILDAKPNLDKVLVFTTKGWSDFPQTIEEAAGKNKMPLGRGFPKFSWGTYTDGAHTISVFGLRHPQGAPGQMMKSAVEVILESRTPPSHPAIIPS